MLPKLRLQPDPSAAGFAHHASATGNLTMPAREIEQRGFAGISVSSSFGNLSQCIGLALATERIAFATAVAPIYAQSIDEFAQTCAYLHEVSGGRFQFGIGIAHAPAHVRMEVKPMRDQNRLPLEA
jgi:alkanesulfonate monooxygenase SsuD/methylene tetrahydromethanopterin reductase-like flavin-dependent oxidoreductase (luciferase family)